MVIAPALARARMTLAPTVVFDLDGTLIDTAPDLVATLNAVLAHAGLPPVAYADARKMVGGGARMMLERGLAYRCYMSAQELDALRAAQMARGEKPRYDGRWRDDRLALRGIKQIQCILYCIVTYVILVARVGKSNPLKLFRKCSAREIALVPSKRR